MFGDLSLCVCFSSPCACSNDTFTIHFLRPAEVVVYIAGGATYEEATKVAELNASGGIQVVLGGSYVHNSGTFLEDLDDAFGRGGV